MASARRVGKPYLLGEDYISGFLQRAFGANHGLDRMAFLSEGHLGPFALECVLDLAETNDLPGPSTTMKQPDAPASARMLLDLLVLFAVDESRNYAPLWKSGGGKYMPARIALGVIFGTMERRDLLFLGKGAGGGSSVQGILERASPLAMRFVNPRLPVNPPEGTPTPRQWWSYKSLAADTAALSE